MNNLLILTCVTLLITGSISAQSNIRSVDFKNFTYDADYCGGEKSKKITVKDGKFQKEMDPDAQIDAMYYEIYGIEYGDLDGDGKEEAILLSMCNTGGTGNFTEAYVYKIVNRKPVRIMLLSGGDRAFGGLRKAWIDKGVLVVESNDAGAAGGACCPEFIVTNKYRYTGKTLKEVGKSTKREIYPSKRIAFKKGEFGTTFVLRMSADEEIKRYVIGAAKGQTLVVTKTSTVAEVTLKRGNANVLEEDSSLVAKLNETGDFVFEIGNFSNKNLKFSVTVTIK
jgi:hypothetical protein